MPTRNCESQASGSRAAAEGSGAESGEAEGLGDGQRTESRPPARQSADKMKALQKSQGRTDQILGAMADMLTSLALPNQQWTGESGEAEQAVDEEARPAAAAAAQGPWERDQESQDWEQGSQDSMEKGQREPEDSYSAAGSEGSISTSVASLPPGAACGASAPSSPSSRRSVSTLKKWLTNPVRKLSAGAAGGSSSSNTAGGGGGGGGERQVRPPFQQPLPTPQGSMLSRHGLEQGGYTRANTDEQLTILADRDRELEWRDSLAGPEDCMPGVLQSHSYQSDSLHGSTSMGLTQITQSTTLQSEDNGSLLMDDTSSHSSATVDSEEERRSALEKSMYVLKELIETEKMYVDDLGLIVDGYMGTMNAKGVPEDMKGKDKIVFGNIHQIYDWHKDYFLGELEKCVAEPERLAHLFIKHVSGPVSRAGFVRAPQQGHVRECGVAHRAAVPQAKGSCLPHIRSVFGKLVNSAKKTQGPLSEHIVSEYIETYFEELKQQLGHRLQLNDLLIKPVQRIMKYQLLLKDFHKYYTKAGLATEELEKAVEVMCFVPKRCNDMMNVGRLQGFEGKITAQGKLLQQDTFTVTELDCGFLSRAKERRVFLFEQIVIFSEPIDRKKGFSIPGYIFKSSIKISCLGVEACVEGDPCRFALTSRGADGNTVRFVLQSSCPNTSQAWTADVGQILESQRNFLNALQSPIEYQRRESKSNSLGRSMRPPLSAAAGLRPHSSASIDRHRLPCLRSHNASLPSLYLPSQGPADTQLQPEPCCADSSLSQTVSPAHVQLAFGEQTPSAPHSALHHPGVSNGLGPASSSSTQRGGDSYHRGMMGDGGQVPGSSLPRRSSNLAQLDEDDL
ncbi:rho guanine nucleotide exchange factor 25 [Alosa alosa]|uniref:rho guanine nucleotide exchange factor 25 n=1 Tax=Alosa alosa TaxID=278164 RepID=UPI002015131D|nr:rho guanine nucleotide exchange factor 25 [Alosa alosa]